jgi:hypothetical protein
MTYVPGWDDAVKVKLATDPDWFVQLDPDASKPIPGLSSSPAAFAIWAEQTTKNDMNSNVAQRMSTSP